MIEVEAGEETARGIVALIRERKIKAEIISRPTSKEVKDKLKEIAECKGAYNEDRLKHAENVISNSKKLAEECMVLIDALQDTGQQRQLLLGFASYVNKNELKEAGDQVTDYSVKAFLKHINQG